MTSPRADTERYRTNPRLLTRRVAVGALVCAPAQSAYQDVRVLRLDAVATSVIESARAPRTRDELASILDADVSAGELDELVDGLCASRVLERLPAAASSGSRSAT